jgi:hypothetical protein
MELARNAGRPLGQDGTFTLPAISFDTPVGGLGPWRFEMTREANATNLTVLLDAGAPGGPKVTASFQADGPIAIDSKITRAHMLQIGVPLILFGQKADDGSKVDLVVHADVIGQVLSGNARVQLYDVRIGGSAPTDASIEAKWNGARGAPVPFQEGSLAIGTFSVPLGGSITYDDVGLRVETIAKPKNCGDGASFLAVLDTKDPTKSGGGLSGKPACRIK